MSASATGPNLSIRDFRATTYTEKDGVPTTTWVMAQTDDGWLWFGGPNGLSRFDGIRFEEFKIDSGDSERSIAISVLYAPPSGELIIGKAQGGVSILKNGTLIHYDSDEVRYAGRVEDLAQDADGGFWATARNGLLRFDGRQWKLIGNEWGVPAGETTGIMLDQHATLWLTAGAKVLRLERGHRRFETTGIKFDRAGGFIQSPDGMTWLYDLTGVQILSGQTLTKPRDAARNSRTSTSALFDQQGVLWHLNQYDGHGFSQPAVTDVQSLDKQMTTLLEDREGNVWAASGRAAIHRLRRPAVTQVRVVTAAHTAFVADDSGGVWVALSNLEKVGEGVGLWVFDGSWRQVQPHEIKEVTAVAREPNGAIWLGGRDGLWRRQHARFEPSVALPEAARGQSVKGISPDCAGGLWVSVASHGLMRHDGISWQSNGGIAGLPAEMPRVQACDRAGHLWLGYANGTVARVSNDRASLFGAAEGLRLGAVTSFSFGAAHAMVAGERGLATLNGNRFVMLKATDSRVFDKITGMVETGSGDVWTNNALGISRIDGSRITKGRLSTSQPPIAVDLFDASDGYPGSGSSLPNAGPSVALASDGRVWFDGREGIAWIDPSRVVKNTATPPVVIKTLQAGAERFDDADGASLAKGTRNIQIDYAALNYSHPERLRFRYRLDGIDSAWVEAGSRRQASYSNLGPRTYRFMVNVTDERGEWTDRFASIEFHIPPTFVQSRLFLALCIAAAIALLCSAYRMRVGQLEARQRRLHEERLLERERIARELHDTLLQSTQGLMLKFGVHAREFAADSPARIDLEKTLQTANEVMIEGRDRVQDLRLAADTADDLPEALAAIGEHLAAGSATSFRTVVDGHARALQSVVRQEAYRIAREALLNAFRHAQASSVEVQIIYEEDKLRVLIRDDGRGIDPETLVARGASQHWGLKGMKERALRIGATLEVWSRPSSGTEIEFAAAAQIAYQQFRRRSRWLLGRRDD